MRSLLIRVPPGARDPQSEESSKTSPRAFPTTDPVPAPAPKRLRNSGHSDGAGHLLRLSTADPASGGCDRSAPSVPRTRRPPQGWGR